MPNLQTLPLPYPLLFAFQFNFWLSILTFPPPGVWLYFVGSRFQSRDSRDPLSSFLSAATCFCLLPLSLTGATWFCLSPLSLVTELSVLIGLFSFWVFAGILGGVGSLSLLLAACEGIDSVFGADSLGWFTAGADCAGVSADFCCCCCGCGFGWVVGGVCGFVSVDFCCGETVCLTGSFGFGEGCAGGFDSSFWAEGAGDDCVGCAFGYTHKIKWFV